MLEQMRKIIIGNDLCVLATTGENTPHASLMAYLATEDGMRLYMLTSRSTRKYSNCLRNPSVSVLIDTRENDAPDRGSTRSLTLKGECTPPGSREERRRIRKALLDRLPHLAALAAHPDSEVMVVRLRSGLLLDGIKDALFENFDAEVAKEV